MADPLQVGLDVPIALFPVRLETRFVSRSDGERELWIRIFPDDVHVTTHEEQLTGSEHEDAEHFWSIYHGGASQEKIESVWGQLVRSYGLPRATHIIREMTPTSLNPLDFPILPIKVYSWNDPPRARLLPSRWRAMGYQGSSRVFTVASNPVQSELAVGPDPNNPQITEPGSPARWLASFDEAVQEGMGIRVPESLGWDWAQGLDKLVVVGVRESSDTEQSAAELGQHMGERFFDGHLEYLGIGSPTNHTEGEPAGEDSGADGRYLDVATTASAFDFAQSADSEQSNARRTRRALGLEGAFSEHPMAAAQGHDDREYDNVSAIQQLLWPGTWGYFLEHILQLDREVSTFVNGEWEPTGFRGMEDFYWRYVRPDGPLPSLRVGDQPYGLLPATTLTGWQPYYEDTATGQKPVGPDNDVVGLIDDLKTAFDQSSDVPTLEDSGTPHRRFVEALQQAPRTTGLSLRGVVTQISYEEMVRTLDWDTGLVAWGDNEEAEVESLMSQLGLFGPGVDYRPEADINIDPQEREPRLARLMPLCVARHDFDPVLVQVDEEQLTEDSFIFPTYLETLAETPYTNIIEDGINWFSTAAAGEPLPLLALLARHSCLQVLYSTALRLLTRWGVQWEGTFEPDIHDEYTWEPDGQFYEPPEPPSESIWEWLQMPLFEILQGTEFEGEVDEEPEMTLLWFLEEVRHAPLETGEGPLAPIFFYDILREYIRFWLNLFQFSGQRYEGIVEPLNYGVDLDDVFAQELDHIPPLDLPVDWLGARELTIESTERYLRSALSAASDRYDAWVTGVATQRLDHMPGSGIGLGGFGYLENIQPDSAPPSAGFVHAPSLEQATTAAVLKSAHMTHAVEEQADNNAASIDLSSGRVRRAKRLLQGLRQGQTLGALLGYRLERALREQSDSTHNLRQFVQPLRREYPLKVTNLVSEGEDTPAARQVVDGLALVRDSTLNLADHVPDASSSEENLVYTEIDRLRELVDAAEDLLLSESVHQIVQGNNERALASLNAQNRAGLPPDRLDVVDTPRSGTSVTHRVVILLDAETAATPGSSARSKAAPRLNRWVEGVLGLDQGSGADIYCSVCYTDTNGDFFMGEITLDEVMSHSDFNIEPIDLLYLIPAPGTGRQDVLDAYMRYITKERIGNSWPARDPDDEPIGIGYDEAPSGSRSFQALFDVLEPLREVLTSSRPIDGKDLEHPAKTAEQGLDSIELGQRLATASTTISTSSGLGKTLESNLPIDPVELENKRDLLGVSSDTDLSGFTSYVKLPKSTDLDALSSALPSPDPADVEAVRGALFQCAEYGVVSAAPMTSSPQDDADLVHLIKQAYATHREVVRREAAVSDISEETVSARLSQLQALFGEDFLALPEIKAPGAAGYDFQTLYSSLVQSSDLLSGQLDVPHGWLAQTARVRPRIEPLQQTLSLADLVLPNSSVSTSSGYASLKVGQMPFEESDNPDWVATGTAPDSDNAVSWLLVDPEGVVDDIKDDFEQDVPTPRRLAGLIVDEWNEVIPSDEETTSVAFHYDRPTAQAPQSVLLAVPPVVEAGEEWTDDMLTNIVLDTMELARLRGVDSALLGEWLQLVPTLVFPDYAASNKPTITTDFSSYL